eukprot:Gb_20160 [translate_table: standard]
MFTIVLTAASIAMTMLDEYSVFCVLLSSSFHGGGVWGWTGGEEAFLPCAGYEMTQGGDKDKTNAWGRRVKHAPRILGRILATSECAHFLSTISALGRCVQIL